MTSVENIKQAKDYCLQADALLFKATETEDNGKLLGRAIRLYMKAAETDKNSAQPYMGVAYISFCSGRIMEALGFLAKARELEPFNNKVTLMIRRLEKAAQRKLSATNNRAELSKIQSLRKEAEKNTRGSTPNMMMFKNRPGARQSVPKQQGAGIQAKENIPGITQTIGPPNKSGNISEGPQVGLLQKALIAKGFPLMISGRFDKKTFKALQTFQYKLKLPVSGTTDAKTREKINQILKDIYANPEIMEQAQARLEQKTQAKANPKKASITQPLDMGEVPSSLSSELGPENIKGKIAAGPEVQLLQETLLALDFDVDLTWVYDRKTASAVRQFQMSQMLPMNGIVDQKTRDALNPMIEISIEKKDLTEELLHHIQSYREKNGLLVSGIWKILILDLIDQAFKCLQEDEIESEPMDDPQPAEKPLLNLVLGTKGMAGITSDGIQVVRLQEILATRGYDIRRTGVFDLQTLTEVRRFLNDHNLPSQEVIDAPAWSILNPWLETRYERERAHEQLIKLFVGFVKFIKKPWTNIHHELIPQFTLDMLTLKNLPPIEDKLGPPGRMGYINKGLPVAILQAFLIHKDYPCELSQKFDRLTQEHLRQYQKTNNLPPNGLVEKSTLDFINQEISTVHIDPSSVSA